MIDLNVIEKVAIRLLQSNVFFASLLSQMRKIECDEKMAKQIPTEAVMIRNGRIEMYYNPKFLETLTVDEAVAVLQHEVRHILLDHLTRMRDEYKENPTLANVSQDLNANRDIPHLPNGACTVQSITEQYAKQGIKLNLKEDDTSENYYQELRKHANTMEIQDNGDGTFDIIMKDKNGKEIGRIKVTTICNNPKGEEMGGDVPELAKEVIRQAVKEAHDQAMKQQGHLPQGLEEIIKEWLKPPVVSWRTLLRKFVAASIKSGKKFSWKRPNRRFGEVQKGRLSDRTIALTIGIDTSGSISQEDLQAFFSEIKAIQDCYKSYITVLECDAEIQKEYKLTKYSKLHFDVKGRGGTSFKPFFEYIKEKKIKTDCLIIFTDLYGDQNECKKPNYPVIWTSTTSGQKVPWGYLISLIDNPDKNYKRK